MKPHMTAYGRIVNAKRIYRKSIDYRRINTPFSCSALHIRGQKVNFKNIYDHMIGIHRHRVDQNELK